MAWIKLYTTFHINPKTRALAKKLGISRVTAAGHLAILWTNTLAMKEDGEITSYKREGVASLAEWDGDAKKFVEALIETGLIDVVGKPHSRRIFIHDWRDIVYPYLQAKYHTRFPQKWKQLNAELAARKAFTPVTLNPRWDDVSPGKSESRPGMGQTPQLHTPQQTSSQLLTGKSGVISEGEKSSTDHAKSCDIETPQPIVRREKVRLYTKAKEKKKKQTHLLVKEQHVKIKHLECVFITNDELSKLRVLYSLNRDKIRDHHGDERLQAGIQKLNDYIMARAKTRTYKSHYHVLKGWVLVACYEDEAKGRLKYAPIQAHKRIRTDMSHCDQCDQMISLADWDAHTCNRPVGEINRATVDEAVERLRAAFKKGG